MLRQIVVDRQRVLLVEHEVLAHRAAGVRRDELQRRRIGGGRGDDDRVLHRAVLLEGLDDLRDRRLLLADDDVDADDARALLVDDGVERDGGLAGLAVADDELALAAADRDHGVDRLQAGLHRLAHGLPVDDARGDPFERIELLRRDRALAVDRPADPVDDAADQRGSDRNLDDLARPADLLTLADLRRLAEQHDADVVFFEVESETEDVVSEVHELSGHGVVEAVDARDAVADGEDRSDLGDVDRLLVTGELLFQDLRDFVRFDVHSQALAVSFPCSWKRADRAGDRRVDQSAPHPRDEPAQDRSRPPGRARRNVPP